MQGDEMRVLIKFVEDEDKLNKFMSKGYKLVKVYHGTFLVLYWFEECKNEQFMVCILHHEDEENYWDNYKKRDILIDKYRDSGAVVIAGIKRTKEDYKAIQQKDSSINNSKGSLYYVVLPKRELTREEKELGVWHIYDYRKELFHQIVLFLMVITVFIYRLVDTFTINFTIWCLIIVCTWFICSIALIRTIISYIKARIKEKKVYKDVQGSQV